MVDRTSLNPLAGIVIDLADGFIALLAWFFRVVMPAASQRVMFRLPIRTVLYSLGTGLAEMLIPGMLYGLALKPPE